MNKIIYIPKITSKKENLISGKGIELDEIKAKKLMSKYKGVIKKIKK